MTTAKHAAIMRQHDGTVRLYTPFDANFVEELKARIPTQSRRWDKADKSWVIERVAILQAVSIAERYYGEVEDIPPTPLSRAVTATPHAVLHLTDDAPLGLVETVYRWLVKTHHPDKGGDLRRMQEINAAREAIAKAVQR